jgi:hypothetical protein
MLRSPRSSPFVVIQAFLVILSVCVVKWHFPYDPSAQESGQRCVLKLFTYVCCWLERGPRAPAGAPLPSQVS